jgi:hypothetical protein
LPVVLIILIHAGVLLVICLLAPDDEDKRGSKSKGSSTGKNMKCVRAQRVLAQSNAAQGVRSTARKDVLFRHGSHRIRTPADSNNRIPTTLKESVHQDYEPRAMRRAYYQLIGKDTPGDLDSDSDW